MADAVSKREALGFAISVHVDVPFEGLKLSNMGRGREVEGGKFFFSPTSESNYLIKIHHSFCPRSSVT